jgi:hypothetical protein
MILSDLSIPTMHLAVNSQTCGRVLNLPRNQPVVRSKVIINHTVWNQIWIQLYYNLQKY